MANVINAEDILNKISLFFDNKAVGNIFSDSSGNSEQSLVSLMSKYLTDETHKKNMLELCEKFFLTDFSKLSESDQSSISYFKKYEIPGILYETLKKELDASDIKNATLTIKTIDSITQNREVRYDPLFDYRYVKPLTECITLHLSHLDSNDSLKLKDLLADTLASISSDSKCVSFSDFTDKCLESENLHPLLTRFWRNSSENIDYDCLDGMHKFMQKSNNNHLKILHMIADLPVDRFDSEAAKMTYTILTDILEKKPNLKHKVLDVVAMLYPKKYKYDSSAHLKANSLLYILANKHPETIDRIEAITNKKAFELLPRCDKLPDLEYIHIGKEKPCTEKFKKVNDGDTPCKFAGGLWASPKMENGQSAWYNFCVKNASYLLEETNAYYIVPKKDARCLLAQSLDDLAPYYYRGHSGNLKFDTKALCNDYDCIYVPNPDIFSDKKIFWGASSLVILKDNKFDAYTEEEWKFYKRLYKKNTNKMNKNSSTSYSFSNNPTSQKSFNLKKNDGR